MSEQTPIVGVDADGRHVIVLPAVRETGRYEWKAGRFTVELGCGAVKLGGWGGEIDIDENTAETLAAALGAAVHAARTKPRHEELRELAAQLAAADTEWNRIDPGDRHWAQAEQILRTFNVTTRENS